MFPDYLTFTVALPIAEWLLGLLNSPYTTKRSVSSFYEEVRRCGGVSVSVPVNSEGMARVEVSGNGCRELEAAGAVTRWPPFLRSLLNDGARFTRFDFAIDDQTSLLSLDQIITGCEEGRVVSAYKSVDFRPKLDGITGQIIGRGVTFGTRGSESYIRIYDKALEQNLAGHWIRVELETRKERAQALAKAIAKQGTQVVPPILLGYLDFKVRGTAERRCRWKTEGWWTTFLGTARRCRLEVAPRNVSMENTYRWLIRSVAPAFARVHDSGIGEQLITQMLAHGRMKLKRTPAEVVKTEVEPAAKAEQP